MKIVAFVLALVASIAAVVYVAALESDYRFNCFNAEGVEYCTNIESTEYAEVNRSMSGNITLHYSNVKEVEQIHPKVLEIIEEIKAEMKSEYFSNNCIQEMAINDSVISFEYSPCDGKGGVGMNVVRDLGLNSWANYAKDQLTK